MSSSMLDPSPSNDEKTTFKCKVLNTDDSDVAGSNKNTDYDADLIMEEEVDILIEDEETVFIDFKNEKKLTDLNYDCLWKIFEYLDFRGRLNMLFVSNRFCDLIGAYLEREEFPLPHLVCWFSLSEAVFLLSQLGSRIKRLSLSYNSHRDFGHLLSKPYENFVLKYCLNIEELDASKVSSLNLNLELIIALKDKLKILKVSRCLLTDEKVSLIGELTRLEFLDVSLNLQITGKYLTNLKNLKHFDMSFCENFKAEFFIELCQNNSFECLSIAGCDSLNNEAFAILIQTQSTCLQTVELSNSYKQFINKAILTKLQSLPNIKFALPIKMSFEHRSQLYLKELSRLLPKV